MIPLIEINIGVSLLSSGVMVYFCLIIKLLLHEYQADEIDPNDDRVRHPQQRLKDRGPSFGGHHLKEYYKHMANVVETSRVVMQLSTQKRHESARSESRNNPTVSTREGSVRRHIGLPVPPLERNRR